MSRNKSNLPPSVVRCRQRGVYFRQYLGRVDGKRKYGPRVHLCSYDSPLSKIWAEYESLQRTETFTVRWLFEQYFQSKSFHQLALKTQQGYRQFAGVFMRQVDDYGRNVGDLKLSQVDQRSLRLYLDAYESPVSANRQIKTLSSAWSWAIQRHPLPENPCRFVKPNKEEARVRYVSPEEYQIAFDLASPWLKCSMELAYICRARAGEIYSLTEDNCTPSGLHLHRKKGSNTEVTLWNPRLEKVVEMCRSLPGSSSYLVRTKSGKVTTSAHNSAWRRLMAKHPNPFTFHDLKARGLTDMSEVQTPWAGHKSDKMLDVYLRKPKSVQVKYGLE